jgi:hypothetical protein
MTSQGAHLAKQGAKVNQNGSLFKANEAMATKPKGEEVEQADMVCPLLMINNLDMRDLRVGLSI